MDKRPCPGRSTRPPFERARARPKDRRRRGYRDRAVLLQNYYTVTSGCMLIPRKIFELVQEFNQEDLPVAFSDVDLCLRIGELGYDIVWTPYAQLLHHESLSRGIHTGNEEQRLIFEKHVKYMSERWAPLLERDPFYNVNATLAQASFQPAFPPRIPRY